MAGTRDNPPGEHIPTYSGIEPADCLFDVLSFTVRGIMEENLSRKLVRETERAALQNAVDATDRQIDQLVYELYGLTPAEIALVEGAGARSL